tara:strand:+ start:392 stop:1237 length:846 start_codon:yes stop_codon:yes gene_type:complete
MIIIKTAQDLLEWRTLMKSSQSIGLTPTMGALHDGHLSLIEKSQKQCSISCVSIFINPLQFGKNEDLDSYPQDINGDMQKLERMGIDMVFIPSINEIYNSQDSFIVTENDLSTRLEGQSRPDFFNGVLTVVAKLFNLISPHKAYFGMKDAQQLILIQKMVQDMKYPIHIEACETIREHNGLAMSSRNEYLNRDQRDNAKIIYLSLIHAKKMIINGEGNPKIIKEQIQQMILSQPNFTIDYISISDKNTLEERAEDIRENQETLISLAVFLNDIRLIDNITI